MLCVRHGNEGVTLKELILLLALVPSIVLAGQGECFGKMKIKHLNKGIELSATAASWDLPADVVESEEIGMAYAVKFPSEILSHEYLWADIYFGKDRNSPIFETSLKVHGEKFLTGKFSTALEEIVFYVRVIYMVGCSQIILEQRFDA